MTGRWRDSWIILAMMPVGFLGCDDPGASLAMAPGLGAQGGTSGAIDGGGGSGGVPGAGGMAGSGGEGGSAGDGGSGGEGGGQLECKVSANCSSGESCTDGMCVLGDLVDVLSDDGRLTALVAAVGEAGLVDALRGDDPLTVFAPTDAAFDALEASQPGIIESLLADLDTLRAILLYHVAAGRQGSGDAVAAEHFVTLDGRSLSVRVDGGAVFINDIAISQVDLNDRNGVIHVLDGVLVPAAPVPQTIIGVLEARGNFTTLLAAIEAVRLTDAINTIDAATLFAPNDAAFAALEAATPGTIDQLLEDRDALLNVLNYHLVADARGIANLVRQRVLNTNAGLPVEVTVDAPGCGLHWTGPCDHGRYSSGQWSYPRNCSHPAPATAGVCCLV